MTRRYKCVLCEKTFSGYGNNAQPITEGRCCDDCNLIKVIPKRLEDTKNENVEC